MEISKDLNEEYIVDGNESVEFKLIRDAADMDDESLAFAPDMCHQVFGLNEKIYGYKNLKIKLYYTACTLTPYLSISYSNLIPKSDDVAPPDNIEEILDKSLKTSFVRNSEDFVKMVQTEQKFHPMGDLLHTFKVESEGGDKKYEIYHCKTNTKGLTQFHSHLQTFILWYIDAASYINVDDERWQFFLM